MRIPGIPASHEAEKRRSNRGIYCTWDTWDHRIWLFNICYSIFIYFHIGMGLYTYLSPSRLADLQPWDGIFVRACGPLEKCEKTRSAGALLAWVALEMTTKLWPIAALNNGSWIIVKHQILDQNCDCLLMVNMVNWCYLSFSNWLYLDSIWIVNNPSIKHHKTEVNRIHQFVTIIPQ
jgi:hypothetical protein